MTAVNCTKKTLLFWDFDNVRPGASVTDFFVAMIGELRRLGLAAVIDSKAYIVAGKPYGDAVDRLKRLQVEVRACGTKREQADRDMEADMRAAAAVARQLGQPLRVVVVSSDGDFAAPVKELTDSGVEVVVVHQAVPGSAHHVAVALWATRLVAVADFAPGAVGSAPAAAPRPPPPYWQSAATADVVAVSVAGERVPVADLAPNAALRYLQQHPGVSLQWCRHHGVASHEAATCAFAHRRAPAAAPPQLVAPPYRQSAATADVGAVSVAGERVPVADLAPNAALRYLQQHPGANGTWCRHHGVASHDATPCTFAHRRAPAAALPQPLAPRSTVTRLTDLAAGALRPLPTAPASIDALPAASAAASMPAALTAASALAPAPVGESRGAANADSYAAAVVVVHGQRVPVADIAVNAALRYLQQHPGASGKWCTKPAAAHDVATCTYAHRKL
jgi:hypothetical protein